jgi:glycosyltransferase involved in cell wall biosynthesis
VRRRSAGPESSQISCLLLVRNSVTHDARVLRAARVAERTLGGALIAGVASASAQAGEAMVDGVRVIRLPARRRPTSAPARPSAAGRPSGPRTSEGSACAPTGPQRPERSGGRLSFRARARRVLSGAVFAWRALALARRERPALVHANDWNTMWCATAIKLACGARVVYDSHELWPDRNGRWEQRWWLLASEALFVGVVADATLTASPGYASELAARYRSELPTVIRNIPEGAPSEQVSQHATGLSAAPRGAATDGAVLRDTHARRNGSRRGSTLVVYVGGLMPGRGLEQTIDALPLAPEVRLRTVGPGSHAYRRTLLERAAAAGVADRLELQPPVPPQAVAQALAGAAVGLCLIQPVCRSYELTLPNKLFEYAAAGVPMLASDLPVLAAVVREEGLGEVVSPTDPAAVAEGLRRLSEPVRWEEAAGRTRAFARANRWSEEARVLADVYRGVVSRQSATSMSRSVARWA